MGTRNLTCIVIDGKFVVAQYGQWDGHPSGQGSTVYELCKYVMASGTLADLKAKARAVTEMPKDDLKAQWEASPDAFIKAHPEFSRDTGADVLAMIASGVVTQVRLSTEFAADSLFCEYAYVIDLDNDALEVHRGFQKVAHDKGRFAKMKLPADETKHRTDEYYPVALAIQFKLDDLPGTVGDFVDLANAACRDPDDKEDE